MKKIKFIVVAVLISLSCIKISADVSSALNLSDLLNMLGGAVENGSIEDMIEGVFSTSKIEVSDLAGEWTTVGPAVSFQSENLLSKAGGVAAASTLESKINPYFEKYGLTGAVFTIKNDGTFTLKVKKITLQGIITKVDDGVFDFAFQAFGKKRIGTLKTYVQKTSKSMDIMFDASKLQTLMSSVASLTKDKIAQKAKDLIKSYDGICVGFELKKTSVEENPSSSSNPISTFLLNFGQSSGVSDDSTNSSSQTQTEQTNGQIEAEEDPDVDKIKNLFKK